MGTGSHETTSAKDAVDAGRMALPAMTPDFRPARPAHSRFRYAIFAMVLLITMINYIDRGAIAYAAEAITREYRAGARRVGRGARLFRLWLHVRCAGRRHDGRRVGAEARLGHCRLLVVAVRGGIRLCRRPGAGAVRRLRARGLRGDPHPVRLLRRPGLLDHQQDDVVVGRAAGAGPVGVARAVEHAAGRAADRTGVRRAAAADASVAGDVPDPRGSQCRRAGRFPAGVHGRAGRQPPRQHCRGGADRPHAGRTAGVAPRLLRAAAPPDADTEHDRVFLARLRDLHAGDLDAEVPAGPVSFQPRIAVLGRHASLGWRLRDDIAGRADFGLAAAPHRQPRGRAQRVCGRIAGVHDGAW